LIVPLGLLGVITLVLVALFPRTHNPMALLRVVDGKGKPIAGAQIRPQGLRTKPAHAPRFGINGWLAEWGFR
jgi:hypothetical protein